MNNDDKSKKYNVKAANAKEKRKQHLSLLLYAKLSALPRVIGECSTEALAYTSRILNITKI